MICKCHRCNKGFERDVMKEHHIIPKAILGGEYQKLGDQYRLLLCEPCHDLCTKEFINNGIIWLPTGVFLQTLNWRFGHGITNTAPKS